MNAKRIMIFSIKTIVMLSLIYWVLRTTGITSYAGLMEFLLPLADSNLVFLAAALLFTFIMDIISSIKWHFLSKARSLNTRFWTLLKYYIIGRFFNLILPSSIGGDLIRIHLHGKNTNRLADSAAVVLIERITGLITLIIMAAISAILATKVIENKAILLLLITSSIIICVSIICFLNESIYRSLSRFIGRSHNKINKILLKIDKMRAAIKVLSSNKATLTITFIYSILFYIAAVFNVWVSTLVFDQTITLTSMLLAVPIIMFLMNIPISIGNIGIMEFSYTAIFIMFGIPANVALSVVILMRLKSFIAAGVGAVFYLYHKSDTPSTKELQSDLLAQEKRK